MRLICPNCEAQYEIDPDLVPVAGRDVECSSCGKVWFQPKATHAPEGPRSTTAGETSPPAPSRQLNESVLAVLREEAARELRAREAERSNALVSLTGDDDDIPDQVETPAARRDGPPDPGATATTPKPAPGPDLAAPSGATRPNHSHPAHPATKLPETPVPTRPDSPSSGRGSVLAAKIAPLPALVNDENVTSQNRVPTPDTPPAPPVSGKTGAYAAGFILALVACGGLAGLYLAAPQLPQDSTIGQIATSLRADANQTRIWLHQRLSGGGAD